MAEAEIFDTLNRIDVHFWHQWCLATVLKKEYTEDYCPDELQVVLRRIFEGDEPVYQVDGSKFKIDGSDADDGLFECLNELIARRCFGFLIEMRTDTRDGLSMDMAHSRLIYVENMQDAVKLAEAWAVELDTAWQVANV